MVQCYNKILRYYKENVMIMSKTNRFYEIRWINIMTGQNKEGTVITNEAIDRIG